MKKFVSFILAMCMLLSLCATAMAAQQTEPIERIPNRVRTIITTDGEVDDLCSMVRCMLYLNTMELEAIISSSSRFHYQEKKNEVFKGRDSNQRWIDAYAKVYDNLLLHDPNFPSPEFLTENNLEGNILRPGEMDLDTEGSLKIKECILDEREDVLFLQVWGGTNTICAALRSIEEEYKDTDQWKEIYNKVGKKVQIWIDLNQDNTLDDYLLQNWPNIRVLMNYEQFNCFAYKLRRQVPEYYHQFFTTEFMTKYIANDTNALGQLYYDTLHDAIGTWTVNEERPPYSFISEGDTPNFFYILDNGLRAMENPYWGGWAGRYQKVYPNQNNGNGGDMNLNSNGSMLGSLFIETYDEGNRYLPMFRYFDDIQYDFAARMEWTYKSYEEANHEPVVQVVEGLDFTAQRGETVTFSVNTYDPDGDKVNVSFWQYHEADTYHGLVDLEITNGDTCSFVVPEDTVLGNTIHVIVEAQDDGEIPITRYQRVVVTVVAPPAE